MPELENNAAAGAMYGIGDAMPTGDLIVGVDARGVGAARALLRNHRSFRDDQARRGSLRIILGHQRRWHPAWASAHPREWSHDKAVRRVNRAQFNRSEKSWSFHDFDERFEFIRLRDGDTIVPRSGPGRSWSRG